MDTTSSLRQDAETIYTNAIKAVLPDEALIKSLAGLKLPDDNLILIAVGKAACKMAEAAYGVLGERIREGLVLTKYGHAEGYSLPCEVVEAGHPVPDENTLLGTRRAIDMVSRLGASDTVLFLLSGGGSALFEETALPLAELQDINKQLLSCGADICEINTIRKRLSRVKGGRFAQLASPARVTGIILSDVLDDRADMIASGPVSPDLTTCEEALRIAETYQLRFSEQALSLLKTETPKDLPYAQTVICGSVRAYCEAAVKECRTLGYETTLLDDHLSGEAQDAGRMLAELAVQNCDTDRRLAFVAGGETVVHLKGKGLGGRNQELALRAAAGIDGLHQAAVFSVGSDGTDGPTDAAGGFVDGHTCTILKNKGINIEDVLADNDSYHALEACGGLIKTGPTGTNVNDVCVLLVRPA